MQGYCRASCRGRRVRLQKKRGCRTVGDCGRIGGRRRGENTFCRATHCQRVKRFEGRRGGLPRGGADAGRGRAAGAPRGEWRGGAGRRGKSQFVPEKVTLEPGKALKERFRARAGYSFPSLPAPFRTRGHTALLPCPRIFYIYHFEI